MPGQEARVTVGRGGAESIHAHNCVGCGKPLGWERPMCWDCHAARTAAAARVVRARLEETRVARQLAQQGRG
jgi:predicted amidophosphoribosyltransferase